MASITSISPASFDDGKSVTLTGSGFGASQGQVLIGGVAQNVNTWADNQITFTTARGSQSLGACRVDVVAGVAGAVITGGVLTITGSGFGSRARAEPMWWDAFANATNGAAVSGRIPTFENSGDASSWAVSSVNTAPTFTTSVSRVGSKPVASLPLSTSNYACSINIVRQFSNSNSVYASWWHRVDKPGSYPTNIKPFILYGSASQYPYMYIGMGNVGASDGSLRNAWIDSGDVATNSTEYTGTINMDHITGRWVKFELVLSQSSANAYDGFYSIRCFDPDRSGGAQVYAEQQSGVRTRLAGTRWWRQLEFGAYATGASMPTYIDEVYADDDADHARIVIGDSAIYTSCTYVEHQPPLSWSDSLITAQFNRGRLPVGTAHAHLVRGAGYGGHGSATYLGPVEIA